MTLNHGPEEFLGVAESIGRRISLEAVWYEDRCNWMGAQPLEQRDIHVQSAVAYEALGTDLYSGTSGVALFMAELFGVTGEPAARRTSLGAIRQALSRADLTPLAARMGLFNGWLGLALVAVRVSTILREPALVSEALRLLRACAEGHDDCGFDLMSGRAGGIAALIVLGQMLQDASLLDLAIRLGDELMDTAERTEIGDSWKSPDWANHHNLTGFSHGAAGAGYALLELFHATGTSKYREAALRAFQYERHWFDPAAGNWPDFRKNPSSRYRRNKPYPCMTFWCHGAPGIALSRLRAHEILGDESCKEEAIVALRTTRGAIVSTLATASADFSLCHGLAGNAEALCYGAQVLQRECATDVGVAGDVAGAGIELYSSRGAPWPSGTHVGETPNLMLGLSGIGHFYLRLYRPSVPSVSILRKEAWL